MTQDDDIIFDRFHDEIDNESFTIHPKSECSKAMGGTPGRDNSHRSSFRGDNKVSQSMLK